MLKLGLGLGNARFNGNNITPPPPATLTLDEPISVSMVTAGDDLHAFAPDRVVDGYSGNSVRLARSSDSAESDFGFDANGYLDIGAIETWASSDDITGVKMYDQTGNGADCDAEGTIEFRTSGTYFRFGNTYDTATGLLSRGSNGSYGFNLGGAGNWKVTNTTIDVANDGVDIFLLNHMNTRKIKNPANDPVSPAGNNSTERIWSYGTGSDNNIRQFFFSTFGTFGYIQTTNSSFNNDIGGISADIYPQYGQFVRSIRLNSTHWASLYNGAEDQYEDITGSQQSTDITNGEMDDGSFLVGAWFNNSSGDTSTAERADMTNGAIIITKELSAKDRTLVQMKLGAIGQQHRLQTKDTIEGYFDELIYFDSTGAASGGKRTYTGINGLLTLEFYDDADTTAIFNTADPQAGFDCVRIPDQDGDNGFNATNNYFAGTITGSVMAVWNPDIPATQLAYAFVQDTGDGTQTTTTGWSMGIGRDHNQPSFVTMCDKATRDTNNKTGTRLKADGTTLGYDMANQAKVKYNRNTFHGVFTYGETFDGHVWDADDWANNGDQPYDLDAPTGLDLPQNYTFDPDMYNDGASYSTSLVCQIGTFEAHADYDRADSLATREALFLSSDNYSYVGLPGTNLGHVQSDIAHNPNAAVVDSHDDARIQSNHLFDVGEGSLFCFGFKANGVFTQTQAEEINVNLYRLLE